MKYEKIRGYADLVVLIIGTSLLAYLFLTRVFIYVLPFLVGWFIAFMMRPIARYLSPKMRIKQRILRLILTVVLYLVIFGLVSLAIWLLSREVWELLSRIGEGDISLEEFLSGVVDSGGFFTKLFGDFSGYVADAILGLATSVLSSVGSFLSGIVSAVPKALFFLLVSVIASAYFALCLDEVNASVKRVLPRSVSAVLVRLKDGFLGALLRYLRSYLLLLVITFFEMLLGLFLIRAPYPLIMAIVIALLDLLPVVGVGFVLIPWGVWSFCVGQGSFGAGLLILFVLHTILRQVIEPKIVGKNLGVHPILTLFFIYVGYSVFGFIGLLLVPILTVLVNILLDKEDPAEVAESAGAEGNDT